MSLIFALLAISFLIFFHELGHFLVARWCGVRREVFSIGFGKKILAKTYGNTEYALSLFPFGGYVKLKSSGTGVKESDSLDSKHPAQKIVILLAGPMFNLILAFAIFFFVGKIGISQLLPVVGEVQKDMPAYTKLETGDKIIAINQKKITTWMDVYESIGELGSKEVYIDFLRGDSRMQVILTPKILESKDIFNETTKRAFLGIAPRGDHALIQYNFFDSLVFAWNQSLNSSEAIVKGIKQLIFGAVPLNQVSGVVGVVDHMSRVENSRLFLLWMGLISINLGIINLLPIPMLDGGQILLTVYSWIRGKEVDGRTKQILMFFGISFILCLMLLGLYNDILRLSQ